MRSRRISTSRHSSGARPTDHASPAALAYHGEPPAYLTFDALTAAGLPHAVTTRHCPGIAPASGAGAPFAPGAGGALAATGLDLSRVAFARQVHGAAVARAARGGGVGKADVIVTTEPGLPLAVVTADCLPIIVWDASAGVLALAHVGWRGTVGHATRAAVAAVVSLGGRPAGMLAAIGPSIGPCCYQVDRAVIDPLAAAFGAVERWVTGTGGGRWMLDLWGVAEQELGAAGLDRSRVLNARLCTSCRSDLLHSYRRGSGGRLVAVAALPTPSR